MRRVLNNEKYTKLNSRMSGVTKEEKSDFIEILNMLSVEEKM